MQGIVLALQFWKIKAKYIFQTKLSQIIPTLIKSLFAGNQQNAIKSTRQLLSFNLLAFCTIQYYLSFSDSCCVIHLSLKENTL